MYFVEKICIYVSQRDRPIIFCWVFIWYKYYGNVAFIKLGSFPSFSILKHNLRNIGASSSREV